MAAARDDNVDAVAGRLVELAREPQRIRAWQGNAFQAYRQHFSKKSVMDGWDELLREEYAALRGGS